MAFGVYSKANATHHMEMYFKMWFNSLLDLFELFENFICHVMNHDCIQLYFSIPTALDIVLHFHLPMPYCWFSCSSFYSTFLPLSWRCCLCVHGHGTIHFNMCTLTVAALSLSYPYQLSPAESSLVRSGV